MTVNENQLLQQIAIKLGADVSDNPNRYQLLKRIDEGISNITENSSSQSGLPAPHISKITPSRVALNQTETLTVQGSFFTPDSEITIDNSVVSNFEFISSNQIIFQVTAGNEAGLQDLTISNGQATTQTDAIELMDLSSLIVDLREGGTEFNDQAIETRSNMSWNRTPQGLVASGSTGWYRWIRFPGDNDAWVQPRTQSAPPSINLIFQPDRGMVGIGSRDANPTNDSQFNQQELVHFYNNSTVIYGWYGNNGTPGQTANYRDSGNIEDLYVYRLQINNLGTPGSEYKLYQLPAAENVNQLTGNNLRDFYAENSAIAEWLSGDLVKEGTIAANMTADAAELMPVMIPNSTSFRILGFYYL